jgi:hypothetical protein
MGSRFSGNSKRMCPETGSDSRHSQGAEKICSAMPTDNRLDDLRTSVPSTGVVTEASIVSTDACEASTRVFTVMV